jgi:hypothetical protein
VTQTASFNNNLGSQFFLILFVFISTWAIAAIEANASHGNLLYAEKINLPPYGFWCSMTFKDKRASVTHSFLSHCLQPELMLSSIFYNQFNIQPSIHCILK